MLKIGHKLKSLRRLNNMTPQDITKALFTNYKLNICTSTIYKWEENVAEPDIHILIALAEIFHSSIAFILDDSILELHNLSHIEFCLLDKFRTNDTFMKIALLIMKYFSLNN